MLSMVPSIHAPINGFRTQYRSYFTHLFLPFGINQPFLLLRKGEESKKSLGNFTPKNKAGLTLILKGISIYGQESKVEGS